MFKMTFFKSIFAGLFIGIGATAFLLSGNAFIFTIGIFLVFNFTSCLITGYTPIATYNKNITWKNTIIILIGNLIGGYIFGIIISYTRIYEKIKPIADNIVNSKINDSYLSVFIMSVLCVTLIGYGMIGTLIPKKHIHKLIMLMFPTYIFVVMGLEHIVANSFYVAISLGLNIKPAFPLILVSATGNVLGGLAVGYIQRLFDTKKY